MYDESSHSTARKNLVEVVLEDGTRFYVQATPTNSESDVSLHSASFKQVTQAITGIGKQMAQVWQTVGPTKASVELGVEFSWDAGQLVAVFVDSSTKASMKITLEWERSEQTESDK